MDMIQVEFTKDLETGISFVDEQHKQLIERINVFLEAVAGGDDEMIEDTVAYVLEYTLFHFKAEENIMMRSLYDGFEGHRDQHSFFIKTMFRVKRQIEQGGITSDIIQLLKNELLNWLISHIQGEDKKLSSIIAHI